MVRRFELAVPQKRKLARTRAVSCLHAFNLGIPPSLRLLGDAMPRQESGHEQLCYQRAQEQPDEAIDSDSQGQISSCGAKLSNNFSMILRR